MSVFISYSHSDAEFVDRLAAKLIKNRKHVWIDRYELRAGDSLVTRIQDAITSAGAILLVLSKASCLGMVQKGAFVRVDPRTR